MNYIVYHADTGEIIRSVQCSPDIVHLQCGDDHVWIEGTSVDDTLFWVDDDQVVARPIFDIMVEGSVISGVPFGATVTIEGQDYEADGDDIEFEPSIPGTYAICVSLFPFQTKILEVIA